MNRLQLSPMSRSMSGSMHSHPGVEFGDRRSLARLEDARFFRSWLVYDSELEANRTRGYFNWNIFLGLATAMLVSAAGWSGAALVLKHFLR